MHGRSAIAALIVLLAHAACTRDDPGASTAAAPSAAKSAPAAPSAAADSVPANTAAPAASTSTADAAPPTAVDRAPTLDFATPRTVPVGKSDELSFTIAEATVEPRNPESVRLVFLIRMHNKQRQAANFGDENFHVLTQSAAIAANGGVSETIEAGSESTLQRVQFVVPISSRPRALQIEHGGEAVELPFGFK